MSQDKILNQIAVLGNRIGQSIPGARVEFTAFPSGSGMLDVHRNGHLYILSYSTTHRCFGVDEVAEDEGFLTSYEFVSEDFEPAAKRLWELVNGADRNVDSHCEAPSS